MLGVGSVGTPAVSQESVILVDKTASMDKHRAERQWVNRVK